MDKDRPESPPPTTEPAQDHRDRVLRKWCLEQAFITRGLRDVAHMEVTNVAEDYYNWIVSGISQSSALTEHMKGMEQE